MSEIQHAGELEKPALDLNYIAFEHRAMGLGKAFRVLGTWRYDHEHRRYEPALVLAPINRDIATLSQVICIPLSSAWEWAEETCDHLWVARTARIYAHLLGLNWNEKRDVMAVIDAIRGRIGDLIHIRPVNMRDRARIHVGEATVAINGRSREEDIWHVH